MQAQFPVNSNCILLDLPEGETSVFFINGAAEPKSPSSSMHTKIHTTKKLEKLIKKLISNENNTESGVLGKWNATLFFVARKKCWLLTNGHTKYNVILPDIKSSDLNDIGNIFKECFYSQLVYDGIIISFEKLESIIGELVFMASDNDRSTTGFQNQRLADLDCWKDEFRTLENMPLIDLANRMNTSPIHIGNGSRSDYTSSIEELKKLL